MSVTTTADEIRENIRKDLDKVIFNMRLLVIDEVWGWNDYKDEYQEDMFQWLIQIKNIRKEI